MHNSSTFLLVYLCNICDDLSLYAYEIIIDTIIHIYLDATSMCIRINNNDHSNNNIIYYNYYTLLKARR